MLFKDRSDAGKQLAKAIVKDLTIMKDKDQLVIVSILRGGALVGFEIAQRLGVSHRFLAIAKITHPDNEELAIGAVCNGKYFLDLPHIKKLQLNEQVVQKQIKSAVKKQKEYAVKFVKKDVKVQNKTVIIVDDGVATGASMKAAFEYIKREHARTIILAVPIAPFDLDSSRFDQAVILHKTHSFHAVSQFYHEFHQVRDQEILKARP
ncbi:MAG TPA: phosphoribosyltransferase family protein [Patescibacteria group bacterium]|nr:phosphoribosyltransferase family protein [Patescibacteria group bacterium]